MKCKFTNKSDLQESLKDAELVYKRLKEVNASKKEINSIEEYIDVLKTLLENYT